MPEPLDEALDELRTHLTDPEHLVRAVASGRRRARNPRWVRAELRPVTLKSGRVLQVVRHDGSRPVTENVEWGEAAERAVAGLLAEPFGTWHVATTTHTVQVRVTKRDQAQVHRAGVDPGVARAGASPPRGGSPSACPPSACLPSACPPRGGPPGTRPETHDRAPAHLLSPDDPLFAAVGGGAAKRRQVDAFLRALLATLGQPLPEGTLTLADLGCGNAYLTFAAHQYLSGLGLDVRVTGVDVREDQRRRNTELAQRLGCADRVTFVASTIADARVDPAPDVVVALHACDTATDEALARAVGWGSRWILAAPCCHHEVAAQLRAGGPTDPAHRALLRDGILREHLASTLTDALRAALLRAHGYKVDVVEFVDSAHTPRNVLLRARRPAQVGGPPALDEYTALAETWDVDPALARMLRPW